MFTSQGFDLFKDVLLIVLAVTVVLLLIHVFSAAKRIHAVLAANEALLNDTKKKSEDALQEARAKTEFMANMSHEIRTPMNAICCATELLQKEELPATAGSYISILKSSSDALLDMVNDILDFSKMDAGKMSLIEGEYDIESVMEDVKNIISGRLLNKQVAFTIDIDPSIPKTLVGDDVRIKQILINLLSNSVKYTTKGEINLKITYERLSKESVDVTFAVTDTGCGITPSEKDKLFEKFEQADAAGHRFIEGTGLGLTIVKQLVTMMGGSITFDSELGKGSEFRASIRQKMAKDPSSICDSESGQYFSLDFCVWEDNLYYKENINRILTSLGVPTKTVDHVSELEGVLSSVKIDYIVTTENHFFEAVSVINRVSPTTIPVKLVELGEAADTSFDGNFQVVRRPVDIFGFINLLDEKEFKNKHTAEHAGKLMAPEARLLLVDDNRVNLKVAKALMETFGAKVVAVDSGFEAVDLIKMGEKFDLIFMDHMMPGMDGIEAAHKIGELEGDKKTPIIALTANAGGEIEKLFFEAGMSDFIPKPIVMKHLNFVMQKWLPKDKQLFSESADKKFRVKNERLHEKPFIPEWGLGKVWNDKKIFLEILSVFTEKCPVLLDKLANAKDAKEKREVLTEMDKLASSAGAARLPEFIAEYMNVLKIKDEDILDAKFLKVKAECEVLMPEIAKYLDEEGDGNILTFE